VPHTSQCVKTDALTEGVFRIIPNKPFLLKRLGSGRSGSANQRLAASAVATFRCRLPKWEPLRPPSLFQINYTFVPVLTGRIMPEKIRGEKMRSSLNSMTVDELWSLHEQTVTLLASKILEEKAQLEKKLGQLGAMSIPPARRSYPPVVPKFRNPLRPSETWAGRGKQPRWLLAQLQNGKKMEDFRIRAS
jgi:DNA-binding protein H-NS